MKKYLLTGLAILLPVALTLMVIIFLFDFFTEPFFHGIEQLLRVISAKTAITFSPGIAIFISRVLALILLCLFILLLGFVARWFLVKNILSATNRILSRIPLIKTIYKVSRDIIAALFSMDGKKAFKHPVLIPFPQRLTFCLGFEAGEVSKEIKQKAPEPLTSVFAPTAPHPISGFLLFIPTKEVHPLEMTNEEAVKYLVSCGLIQPSQHTSASGNPLQPVDLNECP